MTSIEVIFTPRGRESISWDVYPGDLDVQRTLKKPHGTLPEI